MVTIALTGVIVGAALALRFKVLVLVPAILVGMLCVVRLGIVQGEDFWWTALAMAFISMGLQAGYLAGGMLLSAVHAARPRVSALLRTMAEAGSLRLW